MGGAQSGVASGFAVGRYAGGTRARAVPGRKGRSSRKGKPTGLGRPARGKSHPVQTSGSSAAGDGVGPGPFRTCWRNLAPSRPSPAAQNFREFPGRSARSQRQGGEASPGGGVATTTPRCPEESMPQDRSPDRTPDLAPQRTSPLLGATTKKAFSRTAASPSASLASRSYAPMGSPAPRLNRISASSSRTITRSVAVWRSSESRFTRTKSPPDRRGLEHPDPVERS